jgi:hypothetical protein
MSDLGIILMLAFVVGIFVLHWLGERRWERRYQDFIEESTREWRASRAKFQDRYWNSKGWHLDTQDNLVLETPEGWERVPYGATIEGDWMFKDIHQTFPEWQSGKGVAADTKDLAKIYIVKVVHEPIPLL